MQQRGYKMEFAERIFNQICGFGEYGFPESHSASFAVLAYVSAWLKYYFPVAFYTSLLNSLPMGFYTVSQLVQDAKRHKVEILPVCINQSSYEHTMVEYNNIMSIQLGFRQIKGLSASAIEQLVLNRPNSGYLRLSELKVLGLTQNDLQQLASADALKCIVGNRYQSRWELIERNSTLPLFRDLVEVDKHAFSPSELETLFEDYASTGLTLNKHPITLLDNANMLTRFSRMTELAKLKHQSFVTVVGMVTGKQSPGTASGVTFVTLEDDTGNINVVVWSGTARAQKKPYMSAKILMVKGVLEREGEVIHVIAGKLIDLTEKLSSLNIQSRDFH